MPSQGTHPLHAATIFLSAFLLFLVQPILAKQILPWFGGAAIVWTLCIVFFQLVLLLGYAYAHWLARLPDGRRQAWIHVVLLAASLAFPEKPVVVATGDGAFGFNAIEVDTAVRHKAPVLIVVANNGAWQIEVHDQTVTHGKVVGTRLQVADYAGMARSFGMHAERVETEEQLGPAIERALANRPALLDMVVTPEAISSDGKTGLAWVPDLQPLAAWDEAERKWRSS